MEISQENISKTSLDNKTKLADDLCRLLQVREKNEAMIKDWLLYISSSTFRITPGEIYTAFRMAIDGEILTSKGERFELFPELSIITTGKILHSFIDQKKYENESYQRSKEKLKSVFNTRVVTESEKKQIRLNLIKIILEELKETGYSDKSHLLFIELEQKKYISISVEEKKEMYQKELAKYIPTEINEIRTKRAINARTLLKDFNHRIENNESIVAVQNICRCIYVNRFLSQHLENVDYLKQILT